MTAPPRKAIKKISDKRLKSLGGKTPYSSISSKRSESPRKRPRKKSERERIYGPPGFLDWIHEQPCIACGVAGFSEVAHIRTGGTGRKDDWVRTVPLCGPHFIPGTLWIPPHHYAGCHWTLDNQGLASLEHATIRIPIDLEKHAAEIRSRWQSRIPEREE